MSTVTEKKTLPRLIRGVVTSNKMKDSIVVEAERRVRHKLYGKIIKKRTRVHAHDLGNTAAIGDLVVVKECRPISKTKTWTLIEIKERVAS